MDTPFLLLLITIALFIVYNCYNSVKFWLSATKVRSVVDNQIYTVRGINQEYSQQAADTLALIKLNMKKLIGYLNSSDNGVFQKNVDLLNYRYQPDQIIENILQSDTTFTLDKGEQMEFCLNTRVPGEEKIHDLNTLLFVAIHELAHIASITYDHTPEFKRNFTFLIKKSIECGVYRYQDYSKKSVVYCGIPITHNII